MHPIKEMIIRREEGETIGITSYCTANELALEAILEHAKEMGEQVLIEATANQINQFGGYTDMDPYKFMEFVKTLSIKVGVSEDLVIFGGDHLGPLPWMSEPESTAMEKAKDLVRLFVLAGFTKIHLDTSMKLADDSKDEALSVFTIARRGVELYKTAIIAYEELRLNKPEATRPVFVIGSEVPIPGGTQGVEEGIQITNHLDFEDTINTYKCVFEEEGLEEAWNDVVAVVVQPGVEFGDSQVFLYDREKTAELCTSLKKYPDIVFEGHSTDYQTRESLREMVEDGIAILKVGPALTFGLSEALLPLELIEKELVPEERRSYYTTVLELAMVDNPKNWKRHYKGTAKETSFARKHSFSDRSRYYLGEESVVNAMETLFRNLSEKEIPISILHRYMPIQYERVVRGLLSTNPRELAKEGVRRFIRDYDFAVKQGCII